jgi:hypothetical protein
MVDRNSWEAVLQGLNFKRDEEASWLWQRANVVATCAYETESGSFAVRLYVAHQEKFLSETFLNPDPEKIERTILLLTARLIDNEGVKVINELSRLKGMSLKLSGRPELSEPSEYIG